MAQKKIKIMRKLIILSLSLFLLKAEAQHTNLFLGNNYSSSFNNQIYNDNSNYHTSFKPIIKSDLNFDIDSVLEENNISNYSNWYLQKIFSEHFFVLEGENYKVSASPIINLTVGKELVDKKNIFTNTRGYIITGDLGKKISCFSGFTEKRSIWPN